MIAAFLTPSLIGLVLVLVGGALGLASGISLATRPSRRAALALLVCGALAAFGWTMLGR